MNDLLYSPGDVEMAWEQMLQVDDLFKMMTEVHKEYNALLPVEEQDKHDDWFGEIDATMLQLKQKIHGWIRDIESERDAAMETKGCCHARDLIKHYIQLPSNEGFSTS